MPTMAEMVEAHLSNVQREISNLQDRKAAIDAEVSKLEKYLVEGSTTLKESLSPPTQQSAPEQTEAKTGFFS
jgi:hypothetical protein